MKINLKISKIFIIFTLVFSALSYTEGYAQIYPSEYEQFMKNNPDGNKYEFVKDYIMALEYIQLNDKKYQKWAGLSAGYEKEESGKLKEYIDYLKQSNTNFRIAKNLLNKHSTSNNGLILKTVKIFEEACNDMVLWNNKEREVVTGYYQALINNNAQNYDKKALFDAQESILLQRKESNRKILDSAMHVKNVLISNVPNKYGEFVRLGVSEDQRQGLVKKMDVIFGTDIDEEAQEGQTFLEASVAVIYGILNNNSWLSKDG